MKTYRGTTALGALRRRGAPVGVFATMTLLGSLLPALPARAESPPPISAGVGGPPTLDTPPPGGAASTGLASVDPSTGAARATIPFKLLTARGDAQPSLALEYSSNLKSGLAGVGWTLNLPSIERRGAAAFPKFVDDPDGNTEPTSACAWDANPPPPGASCADRFYFAGRGLVPICVLSTASSPTCTAAAETFPTFVAGWMYFRPEFDDGNRYFWSADRKTWAVQSHSGVNAIYGNPIDLINAGSGIEHSDALARIPSSKLLKTNGTDIYRWNLVRQTDTVGNVLVYQWQTLGAVTNPSTDAVLVAGPQYLTDIFDTPPSSNGKGVSPTLDTFAHHTHLRWSTSDGKLDGATASKTESPSWRSQPALTLQGVDVASMPWSGGTQRSQVRRYNLGYNVTSADPTISFLTSITQEGACTSSVETGQLLTNHCPIVPTSTGSQSSTLSMTYTEFFYSSGSSAPTPTSRFLYGSSTQTVAGVRAMLDVAGAGVPDLLKPFPKTLPDGSVVTSEDILAPSQNGSTNSYTTDMEDHSVNLRKATMANIGPPGPRSYSTFGDFLSDGQPNALWFNYRDPGNGTLPAVSLEYYSLDPVSKKWTGVGTVGAPQLPAFSPVSMMQLGGWDGTLPSTDIDGDGLTDALMPEQTVPGAPPGAGHRAYLSARSTKGLIQPFFERTVGSCTPHATGSTKRLMADVDGDGLADMVELRTITGATGTLLYVYTFQNRGDGRFGLTDTTTDPCGQFAGLVRVSQAVDQSSTKLPDLSSSASGLVGIHDLNGDGHADVVSVTAAGVFMFPWLAEGIFGTPIQGRGPFPAPFSATSQSILYADADGSGVDDLIIATAASAYSIDFTTGPTGAAGVGRAGLLSSITNNASGLSTRLTYGTLSSPGDASPNKNSFAVPVSAAIVKTVTTSNQVSGPYAQTYLSTFLYEAPVYDARDKAFIGFQSVTETRTADTSARAPATRTRTRYATHTCKTAPGQGCTEGADYFDRLGRGLPYEVDITTADGTKVLSETFYSYPRTIETTALDGRISRRAWLGTTDTYLMDYYAGVFTATTVNVFPSGPDNILAAGSYTVTELIPPASASRHLRRTVKYDRDAGAPVSIDDYEVGSNGGVIGSPINTTTVWSLPAGGVTGWNHRPTKVTTGPGFGTSGPSREVDPVWNASGQLYQLQAPVTGEVTLVRDPLGGPAPTGQSVNGRTATLRTLFYDLYTGNVSSIDEAGVRCTSVWYDAQYGQLPVKTTVDPAGSCGAGYLTTSRIFDRGLEAVTMEVSPAQEKTMRSYDAFGRLIEVDQPSATLPLGTALWPALKIDYTAGVWNESAVTLTHVQAQNGTQASSSFTETWAYSDGFGRTLATLQSGDVAGSWIVNGLATLSSTGRVLQAFAPLAAPFTGAPDRYDLTVPPTGMSVGYSYNERGQVLAATAFDGNVTTYVPHVFPAFSVDTLDAEHPSMPYATTSTSDEHGRLASVTRRIVSDPAPDNVTTSYAYAPTGEVLARTLTHTAAPADQVSHTFVYDSLGRMVQSLEPNAGTWSYAYNDHGDLVGTADARGCGKNVAYDSLGRISFEDYSPCVQYSQFPYSVPDTASDAGKETVYKYDNLVGPGPAQPGPYTGRLTAVLDRAQISMFDYDLRGRIVGTRRQLSTPSASSVGSYTPNVYTQAVNGYDEANRPVSIGTGADAPALLVSMASVETFQYTPRGGMSSVGSSYGPLLTSQSFDSFGSVATQVLGDTAHTTTTTTYKNGRVDTFNARTTSDITNLNFTYSPSGQLLTLTDSNAGWPEGRRAPSRTMHYDDLYRLKQVDLSYQGGDDTFVSPILPGDAVLAPTDSSPSGKRIRQESFAYDWKDNPVKADDNEHVFDRAPGILTYKTTAAGPNQLASATTNTTTPTLASAVHDQAGNLTQIYVNRGSNCLSAHPCSERYIYTWNEVGQLEKATLSLSATINRQRTWVDEVGITNTYDAAGSRVMKAVTGASATLYTANVFGTLRLEGAAFANGEYQHDATTERVVLPVAQGVSARVQVVANDIPSGGTNVLRVFFEIGDKLGSTSFVVEQKTSEIVARTTYEAYGKTESDYRPDRWGNYRNEANRYTGKADDAEVGIVYFGARFYSSVLQRWTSPDPLSVHTPAGDMNAYGFVNGSPLQRVDQWGLEGECDSSNCSPSGAGGGEPQGNPSPPEPIQSGGGGGAGSSSGGSSNGEGRYYAVGSRDPRTESPPIGAPPPPVRVPVSASPSSSTGGLGVARSIGVGAFAFTLQAIAFLLTGPTNTANALATGEKGVPAVTDGDALVQIAGGAAGGAVAGKILGAVVGRLAGRAAGGVAPRAYSVAFEARLTPQGIGTYGSHFAEANEQLLKAMANPETANALKATLGADFEGSIVSSTGGVRGVSPSGWTWHHVPDQHGVLQLVPGFQHAPGSAWQPLLHPGGVGGMSIWGSAY